MVDLLDMQGGAGLHLLLKRRAVLLLMDVLQAVGGPMYLQAAWSAMHHSRVASSACSIMPGLTCVHAS
jgi:hypothetical protein